MDKNKLAHWVFLRGLVRESAHWDDFPEAFVRAVPGARVHLVDLPGNGRHYRQASPLSLRGLMEAARRDALELMRVEGQGGQPVYLLSISLGGMVAVEWARQYPSELAGAVLINTSLRGLSPLYQRLCWRVWPLLARIAATPDVAGRERLILRLTSARQEASPGLIESRVAIHLRHPVALSNVFRQLWASASHRPPREKHSVPFLALNSLGDRMVDPACTEAIARQWLLQHKTHAWGGHDLTLDDPEWVVANVAEWLANLP